MRFAILLSALLVSIAAPAAASQTASPSVAPVDEYFGHYSESVLDMRNRIVKFERKTDAEIKAPDVVGMMDYVEDGLMAWQHKYPADPWVLDAMTRLLNSYARAGAVDDVRAGELRASLLRTHPSVLQVQTVALEAPAPPAAAQPLPSAVSGAVISGAVVDAATGAPIAGAIVLVAPNHESSDVGTAAFATTGADGSFSVSGVALGGAVSVGPISYANAEYFIVEPPRGSAYAPYHGVVDAAGGKGLAGIIRLGAR